MSDYLEALSIKGWRLEIMKWVATRLTKILNISWNKESLKVIIKLELTLEKKEIPEFSRSYNVAMEQRLWQQTRNSKMMSITG